SPKELAPTEDQGIIFGILNTPSNSTLDQVTRSTRAVYQDVSRIPEGGFTFQITFPSGGFWGLGLKPWDQRKRTDFKVLQEVQDLAAAIGGNFVNRFSVAGRSYKVIPQLLRAERLNPEQLKDIYVTGPNGQLVSLSTIATLRDSVAPRALNRFQQLNAVKLS